MNTEFRPLILVVATLLIGLLSAATLDSLADMDSVKPEIFVLGVGIVLGINGFRFALWNYIHKLYPLSRTYPMTALFFPLILCLSIAKGESVTISQFLGVAIITFGVFQLSKMEGSSGS